MKIFITGYKGFIGQNAVNALKDTITTLAPVLEEGKKLMNMFENIKI